MRGAPEPRDFFPQVIRSPFEKEWDHFKEKILARNITIVRRYTEDPRYAAAVKKVTGFELPAVISTSPAADQAKEGEEEEAAGAQEPAATKGEEKKEEGGEQQHPAKMTIAEKIAESAAAAAKKKNN